MCRPRRGGFRVPRLKPQNRSGRVFDMVQFVEEETAFGKSQDDKERDDDHHFLPARCIS